MFKFKKNYLRVLLIAAVCCCGVAIGYKKIKAVQDINIVVNDNAINAENNTPIYWNTNIEANCGIDYSINSDLSGGIGTNGKIIQVGLPTNDGKFYYVVNLSDLQPGIDYYYRVNCNTGNDPSAQSEIKKLSKYMDTSKPDLSIQGFYIMKPGSGDVISGNIAINENFDIGPIYTNTGNTKTVGTFYIDLYIDNVYKDRLYVYNNVLTGTSEAITIKNGGNPYSLTLPEAKSYEIKVVIDSSNTINESNENNNTFTKVITVSNSIIKCSDSDGGKDYYKYGTAKGIASWGKSLNMIENFNDFCTGNNNLNELSCGSDGYVNQESVQCEYGCWLGACCGAEGCKKDYFCKDSDDGKNYEQYGEVFVTKQDNILKFKDQCVNLAPTQDGRNFYAQDGKNYYSTVNKCSGNDCYIAEAFCSGVKEEFKVAKCLLCENGACVVNEEEEKNNIVDEKIIELSKDKYDLKINEIDDNASKLNDNKFDQILSEIKVLKDIIKEQQSQIKYLAKLTQGVKNLSEAVSSA
ncbi:MAG: CARDB domain-containing protein, partial [bacterium]